MTTCCLFSVHKSSIWIIFQDLTSIFLPFDVQDCYFMVTIRAKDVKKCNNSKKKKYSLGIMLSLVKRLWWFVQVAWYFCYWNCNWKYCWPCTGSCTHFHLLFCWKKNVWIFMHSMKIKCYLAIFCVLFGYSNWLKTFWETSSFLWLSSSWCFIDNII